MKKLIIISLSIFLFFSFNTLKAKKLQANLSYSTFYSPTKGPYIETYLTVSGKSIVFVKNKNDKYQGTLNIIMIFRQNNEVKKFSKYNLLSPEVDDSTNTNFNFIDQQRFSIPNGTYDFEINIADKNKDNIPLKSYDKITINYPSDKICISGIQLIKSYKKTDKSNILTKCGYDFVPYVYNFYPENINILTFYTEIYNTDKVFGENQKYLISYYIESYETQKRISKFVKVRRENTKAVNVLFNSFDIKELPSGNYNLVIEARDRENKLIAFNKLFFQRINTNANFNINNIPSLDIKNTFVSAYTNKDSLMECIRSLAPISTNIEKFFIYHHLKKSVLKTLQQFFLNFWLTRDENNPELAWQKYLNEVNKVNAAFRTQVKKGYETDRGIVYLKYGPPNSITKSYNEPDAYPYEIWHYYTIKNQRNKKFVFYSNDIVTNDFQLIHSDVIGELSNYRWQLIIHKRNGEGIDLDQDRVRDYWGGKSKEYYEHPR